MWRVLVGSMTAVMACTSTNPAYEGTGETNDQDPSVGEETVGESVTTGPIDGSTHGETTTEPDPDATASGSDSSSSGGEPLPEPDPLCRFDVYAINELGELHVLDVDAGDSRLRLKDERLVSWAIATDPATGLLYVSPHDDPGSVVRVDPFIPDVHDEPLVVEAPRLATMARATFRGPGELWLGTDETHRFLWLPPSGGTVWDYEPFDPFERGGDMVFLEGNDDCALVPTLAGVLYWACFPIVSGELPEQLVEDLPAGPQFTGIAIDEQDRMWLSNADPVPQLVPIDRAGEPWTAMEPVPYDMTMNDLAPVIHTADGC